MSSSCLNTLLQAQHTKLSPAVDRAPWQGQPNEFVYDVLLEPMGWKIEVKTAREHFGRKNRKWNWSQLRKDDQHTHVCLMAVSPDRVRIALLTRAQLRTLPCRHKQGKTGEYEQLKLTETSFSCLHAQFALGVSRLLALGQISSPCRVPGQRR